MTLPNIVRKENTFLPVGVALDRLRRVLPSYAFAWDWLWEAMRSGRVEVNAERQFVYVEDNKLFEDPVEDRLVSETEEMIHQPFHEGSHAAVYPFIENGQLRIFRYTGYDGLAAPVGSDAFRHARYKIRTDNVCVLEEDIKRYCGDNDDISHLADHLEHKATERKQGKENVVTGRTPNALWIKALMHVIAWTEVNNGLPETQAELCRVLSRWYSDNGHEEPSSSRLKDYARDIMAEVGRLKSST